MSLDYYKAKDRHEGGGKALGHYSDLFAGLSFIFLFLFVILLFQNSIQQAQHVEKTDAIDQEYLSHLQQVSSQYKNHMSKLQEDASQYLEETATPKEKDLYKDVYEKLSKVTKSKVDEIKKRKVAIEKEKNFIAAAKEKISDVNSLESSLERVLYSQLAFKQKAKKNQDDLVAQSKQEKQQLQAKSNEQLKKLAQDSTKKIAQIHQDQSKSEQKFKDYIKTQEEKLQQHNNKSRKKLQNLNSKVKNLNEKISTLKQQNNALDKLHSKTVNKNKNLEHKLGSMGNSIANLKADNKDLRGKLQNEVKLKQDQEKLYDQLKQKFKENQVAVTVDKKKSEIIIPFEDSYFDFDSSILTSPMKRKLAKIIPIFSQTIFENYEYKSKIKKVHIIGYSSPVYNGVYIDPQQLDAHGREGLIYNMDLSYRRALSIFKYMFDPSQLSYDHQKQLLNYTRVASNSYIISTLEPLKNPQSLDDDHGLSKGRLLCTKYNCKSWQKVSVKIDFN